ncbi:MAG: hypothetical protein GXP30_02630 [Verrucomicrobia bacterium]|nr:hypothetical protein [Verrucomicrobiota bacterium]
MKNTSYLKKLPFIIAMTLAFAGCSKQPRFDITGEWKINPDKSALEVIKAGKVAADKIDQIKQDISKRVERFTIVVDDQNLNVKGKPLPYVIVSESLDKVVAEADAGGQKVTLTFAIYDDESITIKSSATNDMDYYVWDKSRDGGSVPES